MANFSEYYHFCCYKGGHLAIPQSRHTHSFGEDHMPRLCQWDVSILKGTLLLRFSS